MRIDVRLDQNNVIYLHCNANEGFSTRFLLIPMLLTCQSNLQSSFKAGKGGRGGFQEAFLCRLAFPPIYKIIRQSGRFAPSHYCCLGVAT